MQFRNSKISSSKFLSWILLPQNNLLNKLLPILYLFFLQLITGIPKPGALVHFNAAEFAILFSKKLYDYPFWLQDLSHLPLFFVFTWLSHWFFSQKHIGKKVNIKAITASVFYAIFNEGIQAFVPDRFPSPGDLFMNLSGVAIATILFVTLQKKLHNQSKN